MTQSARGLRLGIFGGAFDPPHLAHRALVEAALAQMHLDRLHVVPTGQAWHKARDLSHARDRVAMAQLAFADLPRVLVDTREVARASPSYTVDTLREMRLEFPESEMFLFIGQDQAQALPSWHAWEEVVALAIICVAARADVAGNTPEFAPPMALKKRFEHLRLPMSAASATEIRQRVRTGQGIVPLVGDAVARYIVLHRLYQPT